MADNLENIADAAYDKAAEADEAAKVDDVKNDDVNQDDADTSKKADDNEEDKEDDDEGYTADELDDDEDKEDKAPEKKEATPVDVEKLPPREQYIYQNLPDITVTDVDGNTYEVKVAQELPEDFEFKNKRDEAVFNQRIVEQERRANKLLDDYTNKDNQQKAEDFLKQEKSDIQSDLVELQKEGMIGKFKLKPSDEGFANDPNVKLTQDIVDFYEKENLSLAQAGKAYRITFKHAAEIYLSRNKKPEVKGDLEREEASSKVSSSQQGDKDKGSRTKFRPGTQISDIMDFWDSRL